MDDWTVQTYEQMLLNWYYQQPEKERLRVNSPHHSHSESGIWDSDNGAIANHVCYECALWRHARMLAESAPTQGRW